MAQRSLVADGPIHDSMTHSHATLIQLTNSKRLVSLFIVPNLMYALQITRSLKMMVGKH